MDPFWIVLGAIGAAIGYIAFVAWKGRGDGK